MTTTDQDGRFSFSGLAPWEYRIEKVADSGSPLADSRRFRPGAEEVHLIDRATYLHVRVRGESPAAEGVAISCLRATAGRVARGTPLWRYAVRLRLEPGDGSVLFEVEPGGEYVVGAVAGASAGETLVRVPPSLHRLEHGLDLGPERATGKLIVELEEPGGSTYRSSRQIDLRLELGTSVGRADSSLGSGSRDVLEVPAGTYRLSVRTQPWMMCGSGPPLGPVHPTVLRSVEVVAGQEQTLRIRLEEKGTLCVRREETEGEDVHLELELLDVEGVAERRIVPDLVLEPYHPSGRSRDGHGRDPRERDDRARALAQDADPQRCVRRTFPVKASTLRV